MPIQPAHPMMFSACCCGMTGMEIKYLTHGQRDHIPVLLNLLHRAV